MARKSEFGQGCAYCLGMFLAHEGQYARYSEMFGKMESTAKRMGHDYEPKQRAASLFFYGASDHLFDMVMPKKVNKRLQRRLIRFRDRCVSLRMPMDLKKEATPKDVEWAFAEARLLLRAIDNYMGVETVKGQWE